ncbi:hypothetical protein ACFVTZ_02190 [Cellulosimicrobium cellulans]|uniref:hypothetical protein n=1 Tax=Cellulosimicrobium cellulans TaxID=1710 RepID=UPI0036EE48B4
MEPVIVGALIGLAGGVAGAAIGGGTSLWLASRAREHQREDRDALRWADERRSAYLRFLREAEKAERFIDAAPRSEAEPGYGMVPKETLPELWEAFDELRLIAPMEVVVPANNYLYNLTWPLPNALAYLAMAHDERPYNAERVERTGALLESTRQEVRKHEKATRAAMRENLGTGPEFDLPAAETVGEASG